MGRKKILIIDDERELAEVLQSRLEAADYEVDLARDGEEGLAKVQNGRPDLILLDVMMPKWNGFQVCRKLKSDEATRKIPVVLLTAKAQESDKFWGTECGADAYITKPFQPEGLLKKIEELFNISSHSSK